ncbi:hypothetical protein AB0M44_29000 [Streptosporangium subroseum]|uniref:hypothetical protein n=1 Tax=Streptosporangium subroseum TaxID=106412 RepID=UPI0034349F66
MNMNTYYTMTPAYTMTSAEDAARALKRGVVVEHLDHAPEQANKRYLHAFDAAVKDQDLMLESYAIRHLGGQAIADGDMAGLDLLRRSYRLCADLGARSQIASAAVMLAACLPPGAEAEQMKETAAHTARELGLTWLIKALRK